MKNYLPTLPAISREALGVLAGALIAAMLIGQFPSLRTWIHEQWTGQPAP